MADPIIPTHRITHKNGTSVDLPLNSTVQVNLVSRAPGVPERAMRSVAAAFQGFAIRHVEGFDLRFVEPEDITQRPLTQSEQAYYLNARNQQMDRDGASCDQCTMCDLGSHALCRSGNCPVVYG